MSIKPVLTLISLLFFISSAAFCQGSSKGDPKKNSRTFNHPPMKDYGLKEYIYLSRDLPHSENKPWKLVCQIPYNCHFQPWIELESTEGKEVSLNSSNPLVLYLTKTEKSGRSNCKICKVPRNRVRYKICRIV